MQQSHARSMLYAIMAAALFGASTPLSKILLENVEPIPLAGLLYIGSGICALIFLWAQRKRAAHSVQKIEAPISRNDLTWLVGALLTGGIAAPIVLLFSLRITPASSASLLLNFEGVATTLIAAIAFREAVGRRVWLSIAAMTVASILLTWNVSSEWGISIGALGVLVACSLWGLDNNFTRNISAKSPMAIVAVKGLGAGTFSLILSSSTGSPFPSFPSILLALLLGSVSYGLSIMLFILALRGIGTARTSALFGTAPFIGALLSFLIFWELPNAVFLVAFSVMVGGAYLLLNEEHAHRHEHVLVEHDHRHRHDDDHHIHSHPGSTAEMEHSHTHRHEGLVHVHPHAPDIHHRHMHPD